MKSKFILAIGLSILSTWLYGNSFRLSGIVLDKNTDEVVEYASLVLLQKDSTFVEGASSDTTGKFIFENIYPGNYILSATFFGYGKTYLDINVLNEDKDLGNLYLKPSETSLDEVTVTASSVIQKADRKIILPTASQIKASNSGVTLLRNLQLSRIIVNPLTNEITVPGGEGVQLRINGVEVTIAEVVSLLPEDILRIEYHDSPGMRYNNAAAVIDYITKQRLSGGSVSANLFNVPYNKMGWGENFASGKVNYKKSEFGANVYWSRREIDWTRENEETFHFPDHTLVRKEEGQPTSFKTDMVNMRLNYNLSETDKYLFNATFRYNLQDTPEEFTNRNSIITSSDGNTPLSVSDLSSWKSKAPSLDLYYQHNLQKNQLLIFNLVGTYIDSKSIRQYQEKQEEILLTDIYSKVTGDKYSLIGEGIYEKGFESSRLSVGIKHNQSYTDNIYSGNVNMDINLKFAETYGYVEYQ
ncbi:MAG: carboxypeptidase-like regulatory domain-containing protein [Candidatus Azobacteroides sp.]|nr:carboxypeptidase-like regulatory domain-containing protein [Candidatus Azobacteroides sp.]